MSNSLTIKRKSFCKYSVLFIGLFFLLPISYGQQIPDDRIIDISSLHDFLKSDVQRSLLKDGEISNDLLAEHFRTVFSKRYYYDWQDKDLRFKKYESLYKRKKTHSRRAVEHMSIFESDTPRKLPFNSKQGKEITSYPYRHLARQHKMFDIGLQYYYAQRNFNFMSILYPYDGYNECLKKENKKIGEWKLNDPVYTEVAEYSLSKDDHAFLFKVEEYEVDNMSFSFSTPMDLYISLGKKGIDIYRF